MPREVTVQPSSQQLTDVNYLEIMLTPRKTPAREGVLTKQEFYQLLQVAQRPEEKALLALGVLGLRASEIVAIRREWIDFQSKLITIPSQVAKMGHGRRVPYGGIRILATIIEAYFLMADRLPWGTRTGVYKAVKRLAKLAGIVKPLTPHGLRATGATWFAEAGWSTEELRQHFGWRLIKTAQHYVESSGEAAIRAMKEKGEKVL
jgi:integrase